MSKTLQFSLAVIFLYISPFLILGESTYVLIHDNLDSVVIFFQTLADDKLYFSDSSVVIPDIGVGLPREILPSQWNFVSLLFFLFRPFTAYSINFILQHFAAFFSFRLLLQCFYQDRKDEINLASLAFALLPFWPFGNGTIALMPLVLWAFFSWRKGENKRWCLLIFGLVPFWSSFYLAAMYTCMIMFSILAVDFMKNRKVTSGWFLVGAHVFIYLLLDYRLILHVINKTFPSIRLEMVEKLPPFKFRDLENLFLYGQYHASSIHHFIIMPSVILISFITIVQGQLRSPWLKKIALFVLIAVLTTLLSRFWNLPISNVFREIPVIKMVRLERIFFLFPLIWGMIFFYCLALSRDIIGLPAVWIFAILQTGVLFWKSDFYTNYDNERVSFRDFYATDEIPELLKNLPADSEARFMAIGIHPAILNYHRLKTLDFYIPHYPLAYKKIFYSFISEEIKKDERSFRYFTESGIRAYFFHHQIGIFESGTKPNCPLEGIDVPAFNFQEIAKYRGKYFISPCPIKSWEPISSSYSSAYRQLYLYQNPMTK